MNKLVFHFNHLYDATRFCLAAACLFVRMLTGPPPRRLLYTLYVRVEWFPVVTVFSETTGALCPRTSNKQP